MGLPGPGLVEVVFGSGLRLGGIELSGLIEVIWRGPPGDLFRVGATEIEFSLGRPPGGVEERWRGGLADVGEDLGNGHGVGQNRSEAELAEGKRDEGEGGTAGWADQREDPIRSWRKSWTVAALSSCEVGPLQGKGGPGAVTDQALDPGPVGGRYRDFAYMYWLSFAA